MCNGSRFQFVTVSQRAATPFGNYNQIKNLLQMNIRPFRFVTLDKLGRGETGYLVEIMIFYLKKTALLL